MLLTTGATLSLRGTHGTSKSRATSILSLQKFRESSDGLCGPGVYFWAFEKEIDFAKRLAANWWRTACSPKYNAYKDDEDGSLAVLKADITPSTENYFDATTDNFLELLSKTAESSEEVKNKKDAIKLRAVLLEEIEKEKNIDFSVIRIEVDVPGQVKGEDSAPPFYWLKKQAPCYVVKSRIEEVIANIEQIEA